jgi:hypothetical protein
MQPATEANQRIAKNVTIKSSKRMITEISSASEASKTTKKIRMKGNPPCEVREVSKTIRRRKIDESKYGGKDGTQTAKKRNRQNQKLQQSQTEGSRKSKNIRGFRKNSE